MLDMARERDGQPVVRGIQRVGDGALDIRLGTNRVGWKSANDTLVDTLEYIRELHRDPVDRGPHRLLYQRQRSHIPFLTRTLLNIYVGVELRAFPNQRERCI